MVREGEKVWHPWFKEAVVKQCLGALTDIRLPKPFQGRRIQNVGTASLLVLRGGKWQEVAPRDDHRGESDNVAVRCWLDLLSGLIVNDNDVALSGYFGLLKIARMAAGRLRVPGLTDA